MANLVACLVGVTVLWLTLWGKQIVIRHNNNNGFLMRWLLVSLVAVEIGGLRELMF